MNELEKKKVLQDVLVASYSSVGARFSVFSRLADGLGNVNNALSFAELIPALNSYLSGAVASKVMGGASFACILLFPFEQLINLINANESGNRMYCYRSIAYTITAWSFGRPIPNGSPRTLNNLQSGSGPVVRDHAALAKYHKVWTETAGNVVRSLDNICLAQKIAKSQLKMIFQAFGNGNPPSIAKLCDNQISKL